MDELRAEAAPPQHASLFGESWLGLLAALAVLALLERVRRNKLAASRT